MSKEKKIVSNVIWGVGAVVGLVLVSKVRDIAVNAYMKRRSADEEESE